MSLTDFRRFVMAASLTAIAAAAVAPAHSNDWLAVVISRPWSRPAAAGGAGVIYLTITNLGAREDTLIAATSPAAAAVSIHQSLRVGGVVSMRTLARLSIPAGKTVALAPGGAHLMLEGLKRPLRPGDRVPATLTFSRAGRLTVISTVEAGDGRSMPGMRM